MTKKVKKILSFTYEDSFLYKNPCPFKMLDLS